MRPAAPAFLVALALALGAGCGVESGKKGTEGDRAGGVPAVGAAEFYRDYSTLKGAERFKKYSGGVRVSGTVKQTVDLGAEEGTQLMLVVGGPGHIAAKFRDGGAAVTKLKIQPGEPVTLLCQIGGKPDAILFLADCVLQ